jgi:ABC-type transport system substrate-binding protein
LSDHEATGDAFDATVFTRNPYETPKIPLGFHHKNGLGTGSWWHYQNEDVFIAIDAENTELDPNKRHQQVKQVQRINLDDPAPLITFVSPTLYQSYYERVGGFDPLLRPYQYFCNREFLKPGLQQGWVRPAPG